MWTPLALAISFLILSHGCSSPKTGAERSEPTLKTRKGWLEPLVQKRWDLETPPEKRYALLRTPSFKRKEEDSLRFELRPQDLKSQIFTNQLSLPEGETWYGFSVYAANDFPIENIPNVLAEWKNTRQKTWDELNYTPSLSLRFENNELSILVQKDKVYGSKNRFLGQWNDFIFQVKWSHDLSGFMNVWWNGRKVLQYRGKINSGEGVGTFFKFGLNRQETQRTYVIYFSEVRQGESFEEVNPCPTPTPSLE